MVFSIIFSHLFKNWTFHKFEAPDLALLAIIQRNLSWPLATRWDLDNTLYMSINLSHVQVNSQIYYISLPTSFQFSKHFSHNIEKKKKKR